MHRPFPAAAPPDPRDDDRHGETDQRLTSPPEAPGASSGRDRRWVVQRDDVHNTITAGNVLVRPFHRLCRSDAGPSRINPPRGK